DSPGFWGRGDYTAALHSMGGSVGTEGAGEVGFNFVYGGVVLIAELYTNTCRAITLRPLGGHPYDFAGHRNFFGFVHQAEQHKHFITQLVTSAGGNKHAAVLHKGHVGCVKYGLVLDGEREDAVAGTAANCLHRFSQGSKR